MDPFNVHGRLIAIYGTRPSPRRVSKLVSLNIITLMLWCKPPSQHLGRKMVAWALKVVWERERERSGEILLKIVWMLYYVVSEVATNFFTRQHPWLSHSCLHYVFGLHVKTWFTLLLNHKHIILHFMHDILKISCLVWPIS